MIREHFGKTKAEIEGIRRKITLDLLNNELFKGTVGVENYSRSGGKITVHFNDGQDACTYSLGRNMKSVTHKTVGSYTDCCKIVLGMGAAPFGPEESESEAEALDGKRFDAIRAAVQRNDPKFRLG